MPWYDVFNGNWVNAAYENFMAFEIFKFPIFAEIFGSNSYLMPFGSWALDDMSVVLMLATIFLGVVYKYTTQ